MKLEERSVESGEMSEKSEERSVESGETSMKLEERSVEPGNTSMKLEERPVRPGKASVKLEESRSSIRVRQKFNFSNTEISPVYPGYRSDKMNSGRQKSTRRINDAAR
jgi:hypothetical protein